MVGLLKNAKFTLANSSPILLYIIVTEWNLWQSSGTSYQFFRGIRRLSDLSYSYFILSFPLSRYNPSFSKILFPQEFELSSANKPDTFYLVHPLFNYSQWYLIYSCVDWVNNLSIVDCNITIMVAG